MADRHFNEGQGVEAYQNGTWIPGTFRGYRNGNLLVDIITIPGRPSIRREFGEHYVRRYDPRQDWHFLDSDDDDDINPSGTDDDDDDEGYHPQRAQAQPAGLAFEVHNAFADLNLPNFMTIIRRENNGASNFKDDNNILEPLVSYINSSDSALSSEQKTRYTRNIRGSIHQNINHYIRSHTRVKDDTLEVIQFVLSQDPKYKDLYIETFENECMGGYSTGDRQSCTKGMFERIYMANKGTIEGLCFNELQSRATASAASTANACKPVYLELYKTFTPGTDIDINEIFQKWYNQFSYDAVPEGENPLTNLSIEARKKHFRNFVRQDETMTRRIWTDREFQRKLEQSIQANNIIFETLSLDAGLGRRRKRHTEKNKKKQRKTIKKQRKVTIKLLKRNVMKGKNKIIRKTRGRY
jgi:glycosyltransferase involved in cell wall biosynthesis